LPTAGTLKDNGTAVTAGQFVPLADITGGKLVFTPDANANGAAYSQFTFQVQDDGGTANGGVDTDLTPRTATINVTPVNDAPVGTSATVTTLEDTPYVIQAADFGFTDPGDSPANNFVAVQIVGLPLASVGTLTDNGVAVTANQFVSVADINAGLLRFQPNAGLTGSYVLMQFKVQDDGGTANGGINLDTTVRQLEISIL
jgi:hypothetical protein